MDGREIPDRERKKYFKILSNHSAPPSGSKYSQENITKLAEESKKRKRSEAFAIKKSCQRVQRHEALQSSLSGVCLGRELGLQPRSILSKDGWARASACSIQNPIIVAESYGNTEILHFDLDPLRRELYVGLSNFVLDKIIPLPPSRCKDVYTESEGTSTKYHIRERIHVMSSPISSVNLSPVSRTLVTTSTGSDKAPTIHLATAPFIDTVAEIYQLPDYADVCAAALSPPIGMSYDEIIAIGGSIGLMTLQRTGHSGWTASQSLTVPNVRALAWLSPTALAVGLRNSSIYIWDSRSRGHRMCLKNPNPSTGATASVSSLRRADDPTRLVVAGLSNSLSILDIRMPRTKGRHGTSQPVVQFDYSNSTYFGLGLDVNSELGLVAAGDEHGAIQLYSMQTGATLKSFPCSPEMYVQRNMSHCIRFLEDDRGKPKIMASLGKEILEFGW
ncbi:hypothetical protein K432DRAFT_427677 [Lepidopterella palustris CBS 459.81]|uniref:WD40 repeat-like protein n=1 Tax=Lepidopterella palustris CBS 459.81 TaxID=1314670 RepID=A0A8E2JD04_9PEZI|nr:hypothetical protein K432DRAFT_427677 [Lepidopterella palustris CBS 459.81]